jgi:hypothetical protein
MKNQIKFWVAIIIIGVAIFFGLSKFELNQKQYQQTEVTTKQIQVQRQDNLQLVFMDTKVNITNVYWKVVVYDNSQFNTDKYDKTRGIADTIENYMNMTMDYLQQRNTKLWSDGKYTYLCYPEWNKKSEVKTNDNVVTNRNVNYNSNSIKMDLFGMIKSKLK